MSWPHYWKGMYGKLKKLEDGCFITVSFLRGLK